MKDYYKILGVSKTASKDEIKKAFRKLAHEYHPDKKGGDEAKFKEANEAYTVLSDEKKRAEYDQFGSAGSGFSGGQGFGGAGGFDGFDFSNFGGGQGFNFSWGGDGNADFDLNDILGGLFRGAGRRQPKGKDVVVDVNLTFKESILGAKKNIKFYKNKEKNATEVSIDIPAGVEDGESLRVSGYGEPIENGRPGDLFIRVHVEKHKTLRKDGYNLFMVLKIKISEAVLGTEKKIDTIDGEMKIKIPKGIKSGEILRVRDQGVARGSQRGDLLIQITIEIPEKISNKAKKLFEDLQSEGF